ncbi:MAG TPA: phosphotransferase, partial [Bacillota bacterium]|nr:phosphotransferase [Bacillota bacterium]
IPEGTLSPIELECFGEITALLHEHSAHYRPAEKIIRPVWGWDRLFGESSFFNTKYRLRLPSDEIRRLEQVGRIIENRLKDLNMSDYGLIHADLHRGNLIIQEDQLGIIDFDDCGWGYYLFDVATLLSSIYRLSKDERNYHILKDAYLKGYDRIRALPSAIDQELLPFFVMRDMLIVNFILRSENQEVWHWGGDRVKGIIREMRNFIESGTYIGV